MSYVLIEELGRGGMGSVFVARRSGAGGFSRLVAVKRLLPELARSQEHRRAFIDEARLASRIRHTNVVSVFDVVEDGDELLLVMELVVGLTLAELAKAPLPTNIAAGLLDGVLSGLTAVHGAKDASGASLDLVHRDVSPQNTLVGADGIARLVDFGIAKARGRLQHTQPGVIKGKLAYMAPEQILREEASCQTDVYAAGVVLWEALTGRRLFEIGDPGPNALETLLSTPIVPPSRIVPSVHAELDAVVLRAVERNPEERFATASAFAEALRAATPIASPAEIGEWLAVVAKDELARRTALLARHEGHEGHEGARATPTRRRKSVLMVVAAAALATIAAVMLTRAPRATPAAPPANEALATPLPPPSESHAAESASSTPTTLASPSASVSAAAARRVTPPPARPVARPDCNPPYRVDKEGRRHFKPECV